MAGVGGCAGVCYEVDEEAVKVEERLAFVGAGNGSYQQVSNMEMVGKGRGDFEKEQVVVATGYKLNTAVCGGCAFLFVLGIFLLLGFGNSWWQPAYDMPVGMSPMTECSLLTARATLAEKNLCCDRAHNGDIAHVVT